MPATEEVVKASSLAQILALGGVPCPAPPEREKLPPKGNKKKSPIAEAAAARKAEKLAAALERCPCGQTDCLLTFKVEKKGSQGKQYKRFLKRCQEIAERHGVRIFPHTTRDDYRQLLAGTRSDEVGELIALTQVLASSLFPWAAPGSGAGKQVTVRGDVAYVTLDGLAWYRVSLAVVGPPAPPADAPAGGQTAVGE